MGIYDRSYYPEDRGSGAWTGSRTMVVNLIIANVAIWLAQLIVQSRQWQLADIFGLHGDLIEQPWQFYQLFTYGFLHDTDSVVHILFNMYFLWLFGQEVEAFYGRTEFLRIYLATIFVAGLTWLAATTIAGAPGVMVGASGGIMGVMILWVLHFPRRVLHFWGILPVPAWAVGLFYVLGDVLGLGSGDNVAHIAHLAGVAFGAVYFRAGWNLGRLVPSRLAWPRFKPRLRLHDPELEAQDLSEQVDKILEKISRTGEASLTKKERQTLEKASRRYQRRRN
jgi:membrane associated rhomboid family serine protease